MGKNFPSNRETKTGFADFVAGALGGIGILPWQAEMIGRATMPGCSCHDCVARRQQQAILDAQRIAGDANFHAQIRALAAVDVLRQQYRVNVASDGEITMKPRARSVYAYWQYKNGKIVELRDGRDLPTFDSGIKWDVCWDRSLGAEVVYAR